MQENNEVTNENSFSDIIEGSYKENEVQLNTNNDFTPNPDLNNNLIVNYLPPGFTENQLKELFCEYGDLESVKLMKDKITKVSLGYGFIKFVKEEQALKALEALNGLNF